MTNIKPTPERVIWDMSNRLLTLRNEHGHAERQVAKAKDELAAAEYLLAIATANRDSLITFFDEHGLEPVDTSDRFAFDAPIREKLAQ